MTSDPKASRTALVVLLRAKRGGMSASEKAKRKKPAKWLYPWATEHRYAQSYRAWVKPVREFVHQFLAKHQEAILNGDSKDAVIRTDAVAGESFALMVQSLNGWVNAYISDDEDKKLQSPIYMGLGDIADSAFDFNGRQYDKSMKSAIGISFPDDESWWPEARKMWQDSNYETIRSDIKKYIADINTATEQAVTNGWSVKALADKIIALDTKITKSRANFIARDQIGKLNGTITQKRMQDAGLSMYVWDTSGDERVRESHAVMEGLLCRWDDATVCSYDGGRTWVPRPAGAVLMHPGMDYQCRCCADAYFNELLDEADGVEIGTYTGGSFGGILDKDESEQDRFANEYYQGILNRKSKSDIAKIAKNTGFPLEKIADVRKHIFETTDHLFMDGRKAKFAPDARIALAWQRLERGEALDTDILLLNHEYTEFAFMTKKGYTYEKAHWLSSLRYPWQFKVIEDLENLNDDEIHQIVRDRLKDYL